MADNNKLELVVEVDVNKANASIKSVNTGLSSMEQAASKAAHGASAGIDGMTANMVKGAAAGNLIAESIKKALEWAKEWTVEAANHAAHTDKMGMSMVALAKAHGVTEDAAKKSVEAVKKVGFSTEDAIHAVDRLMIADMSLSKAEGLAKVAKDAAAIENITMGEALEGLTAVLALNPWALLITGVVASGAIIYKTWSATQANLERGYEDMRRKAIQKNLFSGKLKPDAVKKMGCTIVPPGRGELDSSAQCTNTVHSEAIGLCCKAQRPSVTTPDYLI